MLNEEHLNYNSSKCQIEYSINKEGAASLFVKIFVIYYYFTLSEKIVQIHN